MKGSIKLWRDEREQKERKWTLTIRRGALVENVRFGTRKAALTYARGLRRSR